MQLTGGVAIFFPTMGRVPLTGGVVHPEMPGMWAVFGGGGWLSGAGVAGFFPGLPISCHTDGR